MLSSTDVPPAAFTMVTAEAKDVASNPTDFGYLFGFCCCKKWAALAWKNGHSNTTNPVFGFFQIPKHVHMYFSDVK